MGSKGNPRKMAEREWNRPLWGATVKADFEALVSELSLPEFDLLLVGDGSGTTYTKPCGWACVAWNRLTDEIDIHNGGTSCGTNNFAELIPYVQAIWHFDQIFRKFKEEEPTRKARIEIVSDSEVTVKCGNKEYTRKGNACLWAAIECFEKTGWYDIHWTHVYRNTNRFSKRCDWLAGETRQAMEKSRRDLLQ
jgi:ribonuclease HI